MISIDRIFESINCVLETWISSVANTVNHNFINLRDAQPRNVELPL